MNDTLKNNQPEKEEKKDSILKSLAIAGFVGIIILIAWISVQFVNVVPGAFSSLASLAGSLNQTSELPTEKSTDDLLVTSDTTIVNAGDSVEIAWDTVNTPGTYTFNYNCTDGVAVDIIENGVSKSIACDTNYNIGNTNALKLNIDSEKERFSSLDYTIAFLGTDDTAPAIDGSASLTIMNNNIHNVVPTDETETEEVVIENTSETEEEITVAVEEETEVNTPVDTPATTPTTPVDPEPVYEQEFVYTIPASDPNGRTDLATKFLYTGNIIANSFLPGAIEKEDDGAIQFEVKNYGTKTSEDWTFTVSLPNGGEYVSSTQEPLKPNERAILTIGFPTTDESNHTFEVAIEESSDRNSNNNEFTQTVTFIN